MNKKELVGAVAEATGQTKKDVELVVDSTFDVITSALKDGEKIKVHSFGSFEVRERAARKGRNPQSGEEIEIPATKAPAFKAAKALKDAIKQ
ncbi:MULTISPECIES: HU family DNA-binding protein [Bacillus]|uniref:HU family DNA-binding protein n=1 Tax=Bacillus TaxID=1386 RepID=UPI001B2A474B|nr:HU family DNA-binding protein [Bacillus sonorensis]MCY7858869.1 HU family DNA-binding protein [Bacillus sonorensis]MCY8034060.1 HU family DNA-binding protein [Bacillus sonorensis]MCY8565607.1 HU family DNA-binding protein [Bacillus sonorensis]MEC1437261.1 HU family DNA-binding protein [Bacillus sonorensis]GIN67594.1 DNA-binding protein HU 1 [Bacillus sonorensis]